MGQKVIFLGVLNVSKRNLKSRADTVNTLKKYLVVNNEHLYILITKKKNKKKLGVDIVEKPPHLC